MRTNLLILFSIFIFYFSNSYAAVDFKKVFKDQDGCFVISDLKTKKVISEHNTIRCNQRFSPYSTFKIAASLMAFDKKIFKDEDQVIKWDGVKRDRAEINQDQTPLTFMSNSVKWVTEWIMPQVGNDSIKKYLENFDYGNKDFSGGLKDAWVSSSLKISAIEQMSFLSQLWNNKLGVTQRASDLTKKVMFVNNLGKAELYGKTGTGCIKGNACMSRPDKMIGWFVGVLKTDSNVYVFAANASDLKPQGPPGGPRIRNKVIEVLKEMDLTSE